MKGHRFSRLSSSGASGNLDGSESDEGEIDFTTNHLHAANPTASHRSELEQYVASGPTESDFYDDADEGKTKKDTTRRQKTIPSQKNANTYQPFHDVPDEQESEEVDPDLVTINLQTPKQEKTTSLRASHRFYNPFRSDSHSSEEDLVGASRHSNSHFMEIDLEDGSTHRGGRGPRRNYDEDEDMIAWWTLGIPFVKKIYLKQPRLYGAVMMFALLAVPLLIAVVVLAVQLQQQSADTLGSSSASTSDTSNTVKSNNFASFYVNSTKGVVATDTPTCSQIGVDILSKGGNAIEAAIAATLCLGVISPASSGIGGGCYMLIHHPANTNPNFPTQEFIDAREVAPQHATPNMFVNYPLQAQDGGLAIATLGEVKGLYAAFQRHRSGQVSWTDLVQPAAALAQEWTISPRVAFYLQKITTQLLHASQPIEYEEIRKLYTKVDPMTRRVVLKQAGDKVQQPKLAHTLTQIATQGPNYLYTTMAETLANEIQSFGGIMTKEDIQQYDVTIMQPLHANISGYHYLGVGGSSSGGPVVIALLKYMFSITTTLVSMGNTYYHALVEGMKHVFAMRLNLGDPQYVNVTAVYDALQSDAYMSNLQERTTKHHTVFPSLFEYGGEFNMKYTTPEDKGTSHISVVDRHGNAVAMTTTVNTYFGSKVISPSTGILFNNQMDDFSIPGASNFFGLAPSPFNYPAAYKKPLSSMSPSILLDGKNNVRLVGGASGGPRIITGTAQVILNVIGRGMDLLTAVVSPRVHSQLLPDIVYAEDQSLLFGGKLTIADDVISLLRNRGQHNVTLYDEAMGVSQFISVNPDTGLMEAVSDPRKDGKPAAVH